MISSCYLQKKKLNLILGMASAGVLKGQFVRALVIFFQNYNIVTTVIGIN